MALHKYYTSANSNNNADANDGIATITINGAFLTVTAPQPSYIEKAARPVITHFETGALPIYQPITSIRFYDRSSAAAIELFKQGLAKCLSEDRKSPERISEILEHANNYMDSHNLFEVLGMAKKLPAEHNCGIFTGEIMTSVLRLITPESVHYSDLSQAKEEAAVIGADAESR